mmetsp:Transcript_23640/g.32284  ORF Transcript_23640/g.32284 Transcript_23640/m.32284 type:complete len:215 (+) Transcript_23640:2908-3552(+)
MCLADLYPSYRPWLAPDFGLCWFTVIAVDTGSRLKPARCFGSSFFPRPLTLVGGGVVGVAGMSVVSPVMGVKVYPLGSGVWAEISSWVRSSMSLFRLTAYLNVTGCCVTGLYTYTRGTPMSRLQSRSDRHDRWKESSDCGTSDISPESKSWISMSTGLMDGSGLTSMLDDSRVLWMLVSGATIHALTSGARPRYRTSSPVGRTFFGSDLVWSIA